MKGRQLIIIALLACGIMAQANVREGENALVYYMPYTWVDVVVTYTETTAKAGPFVQYAERYLGTKEVITEDAVTYSIDAIQLQKHTTADMDRMYIVPMGGKDKTPCYITVNELGVIEKLGVQVISSSSSSSSSVSTDLPSLRSTLNDNTLMPLLEEQMMANSVAKMAEGAARMIYRIRETRLNILAGEVDHVPADGLAMQQVMNELDKQEKALTALFIGTEEVYTLTKTYTIDPMNKGNGILFRFSRFAGPVATDDLSGEPYHITIQRYQQQYADRFYGEESKKKGDAPVIFYNLPGSATIKLLYQEEVLIEETFPVAQLGVSVPMNLTGMQNAVIHFDTETGRVLSVGK